MSLYTSGSALVSSYYWVQDQNSTGSAGNALVASGTVLAQYTLGTNAFRFGNYRVGTTLSATTTLFNTALLTSNTVTQALAATASTSGGVNSVTGLPSPYLSVGGTSNVVAGLNSATTGPNSGTATLSFSSVPGTSNTTGTTAIGSGTIAVSGTGYNWANAKVSAATLAFGNVRTGSAATSQTVAVGNQTVVNATYQDLLNVSGSTSNSAVSATGFSNLAASTSGTATSNVTVSANTATAGNLASTVSLTYTSNANGVAGLSNGSATIVGGTAPAISTTGGVYDWANAKVSAATLAFGNLRTGSAATSQTVAIGNQTVTNSSYQDLLNVSGSTSNAKVSATGFSNLAASTSGTSTSNVTLSANTATAGNLASTVSLTYTSNANGVAGLSNGSATIVGGSAPAITTTGGVYDWANAKVSAATLAFGNLRTGSAATSQTVAIGNQTVTNSSYQDLLNVSGSTSNAKVSATGFSNLAASTSGTSTSNVTLAANTATAGNLASTVSLTYTSNANGVAGLSNGSATIVGGSAPAITTTGGVYDWANAVYTGTTFAFGFLHRGGSAASGTAAIGNQTVTNASYQDSLNVSASTGNPLVSAAGFTGLAASAGGATTNNLVVSISTGTAGSLASTVGLSLVSNANGVAGLSNGTATVVGSPGSIATSGTIYTGQSTWNTNGGGQWGTLASNFGTNWNWSTFDGSPGVDPGFANTDTATFGSAVTSGTATVTITAATPSVKSLTFDNATASYALTAASGGSLALLNAGTATAAISVAAGSHAISSPVSLGSNTGIDVFPASILSMSGVISGANGVTKTGSGTTIFSGNNSYGGTTTVSAGKLLIHGNQSSATGAITVAGGATLGGRGQAGGAVTVLANGILSPGASVESLAVGATTFSSGSSTFFYEVDSSVLVGSGSAADLLVSNGNLSIGSGAILEFTDLASSPTAFADGTKFTLISYGSNAWNGGLFTYQGNELANLEIFSTGLNQWEIRYDDTTGGSNFTSDQLSGSSVTIMAVPEPAAAAMLAAGAIALAALGLRSRRRTRAAR